MLGDIVSEVLSSVIEGFVPGPSTDRGRIVFLLVLGLAALGMDGWIFATVERPLQAQSGYST